AIIVGLTAAFFSNYALALTAGASTNAFWFGFEAWRWMFWIEIAPAIVFFITLLTIPESPRFLVLSGKKDQAQRVLARLFGEAAAAAKVAEIDASLAADHHRPKLADLIDPATKRLRRIVWVGIGLATFQQLVGINVVFYYGAVLWQSVGFSESDALLINIINGVASIVACTITILFIDRIGRRPFLLWGSVGMAATLGLMVIAFSMASLDADGQLQLPGGVGRLALVAMVSYAFVFNMTWGPVMWVMLGEMFPNQIRGSGLAVSGLAQWTSNFGIAMTFPIMLASIGLAGAYGLYFVFAAISVLFVLRMVHETRGVELEDMEG
ncbi:MAG: MFS transporter, partial [Pseudomonadota bacterium]